MLLCSILREVVLNSSCMTISGLVKTYGDLTAVDNISFSVNRGEILGILGPNGSGKTTTLKSILGLLYYDQGVITIEGMSPFKQRAAVLKRTGAVLEGARNIYWYLSPRENLMYFAGIKGLSGREIKPRVEYLLENLKLDDVADKEIRQFSAGMKQKCALACALVHNPDILLLDEPTLGLDVEIGIHIRKWLGDISRKDGKTILITSHNMDFIESVCDRVLIMRKGKIVSHESVESLKEKFAGRFFRIELNRTPEENLMKSLSELGSVSLCDNTIDMELSDLGSLLPLLQLLKDAGHDLKDFKTMENDLEDIFLEMIREEE